MLQERIAQALLDIQSGKSDVRLKQKLLDLSERVREIQAERIRSEDETEEQVDALLDSALKDFWLGVTLIGSGAETLSAQEKRELCVVLIELGAFITHVWTTKILTFDFDAFREFVLSDEFLTELQTDNENGLSPSEVKSVVVSLVDAIEGAVLSRPFRTVLNLLCEQAGKPVLAQSLLHSEPESVIGKLLHAAWLTDTSVEQGKAFLGKINRTLPRVPFLRTCIALHCHARAFWSHWKTEDRISLLNEADNFLRPFSTSIGNKAKILRTIQKDK